MKNLFESWKKKSKNFPLRFLQALTVSRSKIDDTLETFRVLYLNMRITEIIDTPFPNENKRFIHQLEIQLFSGVHCGGSVRAGVHFFDHLENAFRFSLRAANLRHLEPHAQ